MSAKLSEPQRKLLQTIAWGARIIHQADFMGGAWLFTRSGARANKATANSLADRGLIAPLSPDRLESEYRITDAGRAALEAANGVQDLAANVAVYEVEAPLGTFEFGETPEENVYVPEKPSLPRGILFEIYDFGANYFYYAMTFTRAIRIMRSLYDAKITRIGDNVVLAQNQTGGE